jgi:hypothetical protein
VVPGDSAVEIIGPSSSFYISQRLKLHYVDWGNESAPPMLLIHGGRDHARSWDWVARDLRRDYHVIAPDLRGHGDSDWAIGGMYSQSEFVLDVTQLVEALELPPSASSPTPWEARSRSVRRHLPRARIEAGGDRGMGPPPEMLVRYRRSHLAAHAGNGSRRCRSSPAVPRGAIRRSTQPRGAAQDENPFLRRTGATPDHPRRGAQRGSDLQLEVRNYVRAFGPYRFDLEEMGRYGAADPLPAPADPREQSWASDP